MQHELEALSLMVYQSGKDVFAKPRTSVAGLLSFILHLDKHLVDIIAKHGKATYAILFAIVFCETGLVLTPFLPGAPRYSSATAV